MSDRFSSRKFYLAVCGLLGFMYLRSVGVIGDGMLAEALLFVASLMGLQLAGKIKGVEP